MKRPLKKWTIESVIANKDLVLLDGENLLIGEYGLIVGDGKNTIKTLLYRIIEINEMDTIIKQAQTNTYKTILGI